MYRLYLIILMLFFSLQLNAQQNGNDVWCFGDSVRLEFNNGQISTSSSAILSKCSSNSICDSSGNLILYANTYDYHLWAQSLIRDCTIRNASDAILVNGDSLTGGSWYQDMIALPFPGHPNQYYVLFAGITHDYGLYANLVDMSSNGGAGSVLNRNVRLSDSSLVDGINAIKNGNGRDWWIIFQTWSGSIPTQNDIWVALLDSTGIHPFTPQFLGPTHNTNGSHLTFSSLGDFFVITSRTGQITKFSFDRCTGIISDPDDIEFAHTSGWIPLYLSNALSPNDRYLYVTAYRHLTTDSSFLYQYDLNDSNPSLNRTLIDLFPPPAGLNSIKLGPDNKIYVACQYEPSYFNFPYPDSVHNYITDNLSVINQPDSPGVACDLQKFSVYLGGRRTYGCLPNNPNYALGPLVGSGCDTLSTGVAQVQEPEAQLFVTYESNWKKIFVNAQRLKGRQCRLSVFDVNGKLIDGDVQESYQGYYTKSMEMGGYGAGVYLLRLETEKEVLTTKVVMH